MFFASCEKDESTATVSINETGSDLGGDVTGGGGSATTTIDWTNSLTRAELNMDIAAASGGSFQVIMKDADGKEVLNETLTVGLENDLKNVCSASRTAGARGITVNLTNFSGGGSYSLSQGC